MQALHDRMMEPVCLSLRRETSGVTGMPRPSFDGGAIEAEILTGGPRACARLFPYRWNALRAETLAPAKFKLSTRWSGAVALPRG